MSAFFKQATRIQISRSAAVVLSLLFLLTSVCVPAGFHTAGMTGIGKVFLFMHLPIILCGFICGYRHGAVTGALAPFLSSLISGAPPLFPVAVTMSAELMTYGLMCGLLREKLPVLVTLPLALVAGRLVLLFAEYITAPLAGNVFAYAPFLRGVFVTALPGIILQLVAVPAVIFILNRIQQKDAEQ